MDIKRELLYVAVQVPAFCLEGPRLKLPAGSEYTSLRLPYFHPKGTVWYLGIDLSNVDAEVHHCQYHPGLCCWTGGVRGQRE